MEIAPGIYNEAITWRGDGTATQPITIRGVGATRPIIDMARPEAGGAVVAVLCAGGVGGDVEPAVDAAERARLCARPMAFRGSIAA